MEGKEKESVKVYGNYYGTYFVVKICFGFKGIRQSRILEIFGKVV